MKLLDENNNVYICCKTKKPTMNLKRNTWDFVEKNINGNLVKFFHRYTGSLWFNLNDAWYKVKYDEFDSIFSEYNQILKVDE